MSEIEDVVEYHADGTRTVRIQLKREWVGLTDDEVEHLRNDQPWWMVRDIEAKLKEKNT